jgi:hypothetical protein
LETGALPVELRPSVTAAAVGTRAVGIRAGHEKAADPGS